MTAKSTPQRPWTEAEDAAVRMLYQDLSARSIGLIIGRTKSAVKIRASGLGVKKSGQNEGCFQQGHTSWNKGLKGFQAGGRSVETQFKRGQLSGRARALLKPVGAERISKDGYLERKITTEKRGSQRWKAVHRIIWEEAHGPISQGYAVCFKNGDRRDVRLNNLCLVHRSDLMRRNTVHNYGPEIAAAVQLKGAITRQINQRKGKIK